MSVRFSQDVEKDRVSKKVSWAIFRTKSIVEAAHKAKDLRWAERLVQVRVEQINEDVVEYVVEPYERECTCPDILRYSDYFDFETP